MLYYTQKQQVPRPTSYLFVVIVTDPPREIPHGKISGRELPRGKASPTMEKAGRYPGTSAHAGSAAGYTTV